MVKEQKVNSTYAGVTILIITLVSFFITFYFVPKIPQWSSYHNFADTLTIWGIPNFANVISNIFFCIVSIMGFISLEKNRAAFNRKEIITFSIMFAGIFLVGLGSAYYHLHPTNETLVWDRMPMTIVFMSLVSFTIMERINLNLGFYLLVPLIALGIFSVLYWHYTETVGHGDLRLYGLVQFFSIVLIGAVLFYFPKPYPPTKLYLWMFVFYGLAKVCEKFDFTIYATNGFVSGHTLKHILAAISTYWIVKMLSAPKKLD